MQHHDILENFRSSTILPTISIECNKFLFISLFFKTYLLNTPKIALVEEHKIERQIMFWVEEEFEFYCC